MRPRSRHAVPFTFSPLAALLVLAMLLTLVPAPRPALASTRTLSALGPTDGQVRSTLIVDAYLVYLADYDVEGRFDLYSAPLAGGAPVRLTAGVPLGTIGTFEAGSGRVVFVLRLADGGQYTLYSVPLAGGAPVRLTAAYANQDVGREDMKFALAGAYAVYAVDQEERGVFQLFTVPVAGGTPVRLSPELAGALPFKVDVVQTSDDNRLVAFSMVALNRSSPRLYAAPADGSAAATLISTGIPLASSTLRSFAIAPNSSRVVYIGEGGSGGGERIVSITPAGAGVRELSPTGGSFLITPDSGRVVFTRRGAEVGLTALASAPITGGSSVELAASIGTQTFERGYALSPDGAFVYYTPNDGGGLGNGLLRAPVAGGASQVVLTADKRITYAGPRFSADGARVLLLAAASGSPRRLYSYASGGAPAQPIDNPALSTDGIYEFQLVGERAAYTARAGGGPTQLYSAPLAGGASVKVNGANEPGEVDLRLFAASDTQLFFAAGSRAFNNPAPARLRRFLRAPADGSAPPTVIDTSRAIVGDVVSYLVSQPAGRAVYLADQETDGVIELYSVALAGGAPLKLSGTLPAEGSVGSLTLAPGGGRVLYSVGTPASLKLYSVPIGGGAAVEITGLGAATFVEAISFTPDGAQAIFLAKESFGSGPGTLYRAPVAGDAATPIDTGVVRSLGAPGSRAIYLKEGVGAGILTSALTSGGTPMTLGIEASNSEPQVSPDGARVVYASSGPFGEPAGLVSQPSAGGAPTPLDLAGDNESARTVAISPDSASVVHVVERRDPNSGEVIGEALRRKPIGGGAATPLASADGAQISFLLPAAGGRLIFRTVRANPTFTTTHRLYSVPFAGGAPATLFGPVDLSTTVFPFMASPDGARVAFIAGTNLYSAPAAGGTAAVRLNPQGSDVGTSLGTTFGSGDNSTFAFTADGRVVFYAGGRLYSILATGGTAAPLSDALPLIGVEQFTLVGKTVVYRGVRDKIGDPALNNDGVRELYAADLPTLGAPAAAEFSAPSLSVAENEQPRLEVRLAEAAQRTVAVNYRASGGTARPGVDYRLTAGPLSFAPGETTKSLPITLIDRPGYQGTRTLILTLDAPALAGAELAASTVTITITDDEYGLFLPTLRK